MCVAIQLLHNSNKSMHAQDTHSAGPHSSTKRPLLPLLHPPCESPDGPLPAPPASCWLLLLLPLLPCSSTWVSVNRSPLMQLADMTSTKPVPSKSASPRTSSSSPDTMTATTPARLQLGLYAGKQEMTQAHTRQRQLQQGCSQPLPAALCPGMRCCQQCRCLLPPRHARTYQPRRQAPQPTANSSSAAPHARLLLPAPLTFPGPT
jgi:hypothetical protein